MTSIVQTYYVSTGAKNAMYTLRCRRDVVGSPDLGAFMPDYYLCNLAAEEERAVVKAREYVDAMRGRMGEREGFSITFIGCPDSETFKRRGKLSVRDTHNIEQIEAGMFPFGKHAGKRISDAPDSYVLFFADKSSGENDVVMGALAAACMGIALEKGLVAKRELVRAERAEQDAKSAFIGTIGDRREFVGELFMAFERRNECGPSTWINKIRVGDDIVTYIGSKALGEAGTRVEFKATVKRHDEYKGVRTTVVSRPAALARANGGQQS